MSALGMIRSRWPERAFDRILEVGQLCLLLRIGEHLLGIFDGYGDQFLLAGQRQLDVAKPLVGDHVMPIADGGTDELSNLARVPNLQQRSALAARLGRLDLVAVGWGRTARVRRAIASEEVPRPADVPCALAECGTYVTLRTAGARWAGRSGSSPRWGWPASRPIQVLGPGR
jgi:hypothetical protein